MHQLGLTPAQIAERRTFIGGSDAAAIVAGGEEWRKLWMVKTGRAETEDLSDVLAVQMGLFTEPFNAFWFTKRTGRLVHRRGDFVRCPSHPFLAANLDGVTTASGDEPAYIDFKHTGKAGEHLTLRYTAQCTHAALCLDVDWWILSVFVGNSKWEIVEQRVDPFFAAEYIAKCAKFWSYVVADREPPDIAALPVPLPTRQLRTIDFSGAEFGTPEWGDRVACYNWGPEMVKEFLTFAETHGAATAHNIAREHIKALLPDDVGEVTRGLIKVKRDRAGAVRISLAKDKGDVC